MAGTATLTPILLSIYSTEASISRTSVFIHFLISLSQSLNYQCYLTDCFLPTVYPGLSHVSLRSSVIIQLLLSCVVFFHIAVSSFLPLLSFTYCSCLRLKRSPLFTLTFRCLFFDPSHFPPNNIKYSSGRLEQISLSPYCTP